MSRSLARTIERALRHKGASSVLFARWSPRKDDGVYFIGIPGTSWEPGMSGSMKDCVAWLERRADNLQPDDFDAS